MATKGEIMFTATLAWVVTLVSMFATGHFFSVEGVAIFVVCSIVISVVGYFYWNEIKPETPYPPPPFKAVTSVEPTAKKIILAVFTAFEIFDTILAFSVAVLGFQFLMTTEGVIVGIALTEINVVLVALVICG